MVHWFEQDATEKGSCQLVALRIILPVALTSRKRWRWKWRTVPADFWCSILFDGMMIPFDQIKFGYS